MGISNVRKAVFLDRDGVINPLCGLDAFGHPESPLKAEDFKIFPFVGEAIRNFNQMGFLVFVVTNQPAVAKGKTTLDALAEMNTMLYMNAIEAGGDIKRIYTCLHHPDERQVVYKTLLRDCDCRKPKPGLLLKAIEEFGVDPWESWMVGDKCKDILAGEQVGSRTILVSEDKQRDCEPDFIVSDLSEAVKIIKEENRNDRKD